MCLMLSVPGPRAGAEVPREGRSLRKEPETELWRGPGSRGPARVPKYRSPTSTEPRKGQIQEAPGVDALLMGKPVGVGDRVTWILRTHSLIRRLGLAGPHASQEAVETQLPLTLMCGDPL